MRTLHRLVWLVFIVLLVGCSPALAQTDIPGIGQVAPVEKLHAGFEFTEGPTVDAEGNLYFSDIKTNKIYKVDTKKQLTTFLEDTKACNGLLFNGKDKLYACQRDAKRVIAIDLKSKDITVLADKYNGVPFEAPNDLTMDAKGGVYFSDRSANSVYYIAAHKKVTKVLDGVPLANGVLLAANGKTLYVLPSGAPRVMAYPVKGPGKLGEGTVLAQLEQAKDAQKPRGGDGLAVDGKGNLYVAQPDLNAIQVITPDGKTLGFIHVDEKPSNCTFGNDRETLYITARTSVYVTKIVEPFDYYPLVLLLLGIAFIFVMILYLRVNAFLALIGAALLVGFLSPVIIFDNSGVGGSVLNLVRAPERVAYNFGDTMRKIGLAIAFATIIGKAMMESGAADRIVRFFTRLFGETFAPFALLTSGFVLSIPVFFDTVFLLLVPLAKALAARTGKNYLLYVTAIGAGGAITHGLVPPTPGPIGMARELNVDLGTVIVMGLLIGAPMALVGFAYAAYANRTWPTPLRETSGVSIEDLKQRSLVEDKELPALWISLLPILLPVLFITSRTVVDTLNKSNPALGLNSGMVIAGVSVTPMSLLDVIGFPAIALLLSAVISMLIVAAQKRMSRRELGVFTATALDDAGMILLITSAGGAFGGLLKEAGVGDTLRALSNEVGISLLVMAWGLAVLFKIAQGSGTVSMLTTASIVAGILVAELNLTSGDQLTPELVGAHLGYHPVYLVMAIGSGSKVGSWMNDSGFWVVCKMGGLTEGETFRSWTICLVLMGIAGLPLVWIMTRILPLV